MKNYITVNSIFCSSIYHLNHEVDLTIIMWIMPLLIHLTQHYDKVAELKFIYQLFSKRMIKDDGK